MRTKIPDAGAQKPYLRPQLPRTQLRLCGLARNDVFFLRMIFRSNGGSTRKLSAQHVTSCTSNSLGRGGPPRRLRASCSHSVVTELRGRPSRLWTTLAVKAWSVHQAIQRVSHSLPVNSFAALDHCSPARWVPERCTGSRRPWSRPPLPGLRVLASMAIRCIKPAIRVTALS